jgi:hypothetical protein
MNKRDEFFRDIADSIESWAETTANCVVDPNEHFGWASRPGSFEKLQHFVVEHNIPKELIKDVLLDCLCSISHSFLCILDGATALADSGRIYVVDEHGTSLGEGLHELLPEYLSQRGLVAERK